MYSWVAIYKDGTTLKQYNKDMSKSLSSDIINRELIEKFIIYNDSKIVLTLHLDDEQKLVYRRRVEKQENGIEKICHLIGWRRLIKGEVVQSIAYLFEDDGHIEMAGDFREDHPWFYSPNLREFEIK